MSEPTNQQIFNGPVYGVAQTVKGDLNIDARQSANLSEAAAEIKKLLDQLAKDYSDLPPDEKLVSAKLKFREAIKADPTFKDRLLSALESGGSEALNTLFANNPFVSIPLETVRGWLNP